MPLRTLDSTVWTKPLLREVALGYNNEDTTPAIAYVVLESKGVAISPDAQELVVQGTTSKDKFNIASAYTVTLDQDRWVEALDQIAMAKAQTPPTGVATRYLGTGTPQSGYYEVRVKYSQINRATGAERFYYIRWVKCNVKTADPANAQAESVVSQQTVLEATQTLTDLLDAPIAGATGAGVFFVKDILS